MDIPRIFTIRESSHRIHNPFTADKLATLGEALRLTPGMRALDLGSGSGEMLCTWARDHQIVGTGVDLSTVFVERARARAVELSVTDRVEFIHGDASGYIADEPVEPGHRQERARPAAESDAIGPTSGNCGCSHGGVG